MTAEILTEMIRQLLSQAGEYVGIGWQGGEPTLMGLPFFQKAVGLMMHFGRNQRVGNSFQTNGLLINKKWAAFLKQHDFLVGLSLDGPEHIHNRYRLIRGGGGTWATVVDKAKLMLDAGVSVNALSVVTDYSADFSEEIYAFLKGTGLNFMQFIPCVEFNPQAPGTMRPYSVTPEKFGSFLCNIFDLWMKDFVNGKPTTSIRFFDSLFFRYVGFSPPECTLLERCGNYLVVEHNGDVYSCDFFVEPRWRLGNIKTDRLDRLFNSKKQRAFGAMKQKLASECRSCQWLTYCTGGCTRHRTGTPQSLKTSYLCKAYEIFFNHAHGRMSELATAWKAANKPFN